MAFGVILVASLMGLLAAATTALLGQSIWVVLAAYLGASLLGSVFVVVVLVVKKTIARRRRLDTGAQGWAVKSSE
ncbi:MAG: hypothetical protein AAGF56_07075 [Pseudomonadota bacterium]